METTSLNLGCKRPWVFQAPNVAKSPNATLKLSAYILFVNKAYKKGKINTLFWWIYFGSVKILVSRNVPGSTSLMVVVSGPCEMKTKNQKPERKKLPSLVSPFAVATGDFTCGGGMTARSLAGGGGGGGLYAMASLA